MSPDSIIVAQRHVIAVSATECDDQSARQRTAIVRLMRCFIRSLLAIALTVGVRPLLLSAQDSKSSEAMNVVRTAFGAYEHHKWDEFAELVHPDALAVFYKRELELTETIEAHSAEMKDMQQRSESAGGSGESMLMQLTGVGTAKESSNGRYSRRSNREDAKSVCNFGCRSAVAR